VSRPACERDRIVAKLQQLGACAESLAWVRAQPGDVTLSDLWRTCPDWEWMGWIRRKLGGSHKCPICASRSLIYVHKPETYRVAVGWTGWYDIKRAWEALP
jgi:hypothetical protein